MESKRLLKKTGLYFIGNLSSKILTFLLVPIYAFYIKSDDLGYYDYAQNIMNIAVPLCFAAIWEAILKFVLQEDDEGKKNTVIATSAAFTLFVSFLICFAMTVYNAVISDKINSFFYVLLMIISYAVMFIWQYYARALGQNRIYVVTGILGTTVNFAVNILMICVFKFGLEALFISYIVGNILIVLTLEYKLKIISRIRKKYIDFTVLKKMLAFSTPLVLNLISTWLITGFGRMVINEHFGSAANGMYAFANKFAIIVTMLGSVINMAIIEEALIAAKKEGIGKNFVVTVETLFKIFQSIILLAVPAVTIFYYFIRNTDYIESIEYFPALLLYSLLMIMSTSFGTVFQVINKTKYQFITTVLGAVVTVVLSYAMLDFLKLHSIVLAQVAGAVVMLVSRYIFINKYVCFKVKWLPIIFMFVLYIVAAIVCLLSNNIVVSVVVLVALGAFVLLYNRDIVLKGIRMIKNR